MILISLKPLKIGHKGASLVAPENTLLAFEKAIEFGADYVEFDIHLTKDKEIVIIHDSDTLRTTGIKKVIKNTNLAEIKTLNAGSGQKIPTLDELIEHVKGRLRLQPEIKARGVVKKLVNSLSENNLIETSIISSFGLTELLEVKSIEPETKIGYLIPKEITRMNLLERYLKKAIKNEFYAIHPHFESINSEFVKLARDNNIKINAWTVNDERKMKKLISIGVDGIITDNLQLLNNTIKALF